MTVSPIRPGTSAAAAAVAGAPAVGVANGITLLIFFVDEFGNEYRTTLHSSVPSYRFSDNAREVRAALELYYTSLGYQLLSVQQEILQETVIMEPPPPPVVRRLRIAASHGVRLLPLDENPTVPAAP